MTFTLHLLEAILINFYRSFYYAKRSFLTSLPLSLLLITLEVSILPFAFIFDIWALWFNIQGINIVKNDFVSMQNIFNKEQPPLYTNSLSAKELVTKIKNIMKTCQCTDFQSGFMTLKALINDIENYEKEKEAHFAMTLHILESITYFMQHAIDYEEQNKKTKTLSKVMINFQFLALYSATYFDTIAQKFHKKGIGIIVNDLPKIMI